jgi:hypothetical protein
MTADVIQIRDHQSRRQREQAKAAIDQMTTALSAEPTMIGMEPVIHIEIPYGGQGIDGMWPDTAPSEYCAPESDPA